MSEEKKILRLDMTASQWGMLMSVVYYRICAGLDEKQEKYIKDLMESVKKID